MKETLNKQNIFICKYCNQYYNFPTKQHNGAHVRNCLKNPNLKEIYRKISYTNSSKSTIKTIYCKHCNSSYELYLTEYKYKRGKYSKFCSISCSNKNRATSKPICKSCSKVLRTKKNKFCNNTCKAKHYNEEYIIKWKNGEEHGLVGVGGGINKYIRKYLFNKYNNKCTRCGWSEINPTTNKIPLQVEHIDGNYKNNKEDNLDLICPNCHSLTTTYGSLNRGRGRESYRKLYRQNNIIK